MKHIGIIDYYLSEWHANNYPAWLKDAASRLGLDFDIRYAYGELDISPVDGISNGAWCEKNGIEQLSGIGEVCEKSDAIIILAPSNPEKHLPYAREVLPYGKPTFIDKTFTENLAEAAEIFALAEKHHTPVFSSSALRFAEELADIKAPSALIITGGGGNFEEYAVHQLEMAVSLMQKECISACTDKRQGQKICRLDYTDGSVVTLIYAPALPFTICAEQDGRSLYRQIKSDFFMHEMEEILRFFDCGKPCFDKAQTLDAMRLRDALLLSDKTGEKVILGGKI